MVANASSYQDSQQLVCCDLKNVGKAMTLACGKQRMFKDRRPECCLKQGRQSSESNS